MAEQEELLIEIKGETSELVRSLAEAKSSLASFGAEGTVSIKSLNDALGLLAVEARKSTDVSSIREYGEAFRNIEVVAKRLQNVFEGLSDDGVTYRQNIAGLNAELDELKRRVTFETNADKLKELGRQAAVAEEKISTLNNAFLEGKRSSDQSSQSIIGLTRRLAEIRKAADATIDVSEIQKLGLEYKKVENQLKNLQGNFQGLDNSARRSRIAIYGLTQVVRDLPFGFIAISNNIPILLDQFQALIEQEKGVRNAFKAFAAGLIGAGGLTLAFSVVVSAITALVQRYGSLTNLLNVTLGLTDSLTLAKRKLAEETSKAANNTEGETRRIQALVDILTDAKLGIEARTKAYQLLKKERPSILQGEKLENVLTAEGGRLIQARAEQLLKYIKLKALEKVLTKQLEEAINKESEAARNLGKAFNFDALTFIDKLELAGKFLLTGDPFGFKSGIKDIRNAQREIDLLDGRLKSLLSEELQLDLKVTGVVDFEKELRALLAGQKTAASEQNKSQRDAEKREEQAFKDRIANLKSILAANKALYENIDVLDSKKLAAGIALLDEELRLKKIIAQREIKDAALLNQALLALDAEYEELRRKQFNETVELRKKKYAEIGEEAAKLAAIEDNFIQQTTEAYNNVDFGGALSRVQEFFDALKTEQDNEIERLKDLANVINQTIGGAFNELFSAIENGESAFDAIGDALKRLIIDLAKTVVKALALAAILSLIPGGGFAIGAAGSGFGFTGNFGGIFKTILGLGQTRAPLGGTPAVSGPGGIALSGEVVFVQRGTDLVGVLNRGNARIGRVG